ncbi:MAG: hypothetical protein J5J06_16040 [Phycisphaerae bacterium]|nr:hypothetical protein [Phycisphaerae bacterium]
MYAARGVVESAIDAHPDADISVIIIWIPMLPGDSEAAARRASGMFDDARVHQLWDANRRSGIAYSRDVFPRWAADAAAALPPGDTLFESLKSRADAQSEKRPLWDVAMFYAKETEWGDGPRRPIHWAKQIAYFGRQEGGTSGLFWHNDFGEEPFASDWLVEVSLGMSRLPWIPRK